MPREINAARISERFRNHLGKSHVGRQDLVFCDASVLGEDKQRARILIAFNALNGEPSVEQINSFVWSSFEGKVVPQIDTARVHKTAQCVDMLVELARPTAALDAAHKMTQMIKDAAYVDTEQKVWEVKTADDGTKYLARRSDDDMEGILAERLKYMNRTAGLPQIHSLERQAGYATSQVGDTVEFYKGNQLTRGKITALNADNTVSIEAGGATYKIPRSAIQKVIAHSEAFEREKRNTLEEYFKKVLGPEMASKLVNLPDKAK